MRISQVQFLQRAECLRLGKNITKIRTFDFIDLHVYQFYQPIPILARAQNRDSWFEQFMLGSLSILRESLMLMLGQLSTSQENTSSKNLGSCLPTIREKEQLFCIFYEASDSPIRQSRM